MASKTTTRQKRLVQVALDVDPGDVYVYTHSPAATQVLDPGPRTQDPGTKYLPALAAGCSKHCTAPSLHIFCAPNGPFNGPHRF